MTPFERLTNHLNEHAYKRGQHKGDAPLDSSRRWRNHTRVVRRADAMAVRMHNTDILTAHPDGTVTFNTNGWYQSPTTKQAVNQALRLVRVPVYLYSRVVMGIAQPVLGCGLNTAVKFYDGMTVDSEGKVLSPLHTFERKQTDRAETAEFAADIKESGFADVFPVLYAASQPPEGSYLPKPYWMYELDTVLRHNWNANRWADVVQFYKYDRTYVRLEQNGVGMYQSVWTARSKSQTRAAIMAAAKAKMTEVVSTDVTVIEL